MIDISLIKYVLDVEEIGAYKLLVFQSFLALYGWNFVHSQHDTKLSYDNDH